MTLRLGLARGGPDPLTDSLLDAIAETASSLDMRPGWLRHGDDEAQYDTVLIVGAPRSYAWLLASPPQANRISWFGEPLPRHRDGSGPSVQRHDASLRRVARKGVLGVARRFAGPLTRRALPGRLAELREAAAIDHERVDNLSMAAWCRTRGAQIVVTSRDRGASLAAAGIPSRVVPFGYHARHAGPLISPDTDRDIAVVVIGTGLDMRRLRRGRVLARLRPGLRLLGDVVEIDGSWGDERNAVLRRAQVVLDIQRVPGNFTGLRCLIAGAAGAVYVGEPMDDPSPFRPGFDHLAAETESVVETVARLLGDESRRRSIADQAQLLLRGDLDMHRSLERVLADGVASHD